MKSTLTASFLLTLPFALAWPNPFAKSTSSAPIVERDATTPNVTDVDILQYALTLEHLEDTFYRQGLKNFTQQDFANAGFNATFYNNLKEVSYDESTHVAFLTKALMAANATPVAACNYSFGVTDVKTFLATASILEGVGVSAYLGAAASILNKQYLTAAGSILTVESRHSAYIRAANKQSPYPQAFDAPLDLDEVYTLAAPFITACPASNAKLPVKAFPALTLDAASTNVTANSTITLDAVGFKFVYTMNKVPVYAAWVSVTGPTFVPVTLNADANRFTMSVPAGFGGQSYVLLTTRNDTLTDDTVLAGPAVVEVTSTAGGS